MLRVIVFAGLLGGAVYGQYQDSPFPGHKVVGNVYYVGSRTLSSYLITTPKGHILINSSFEETVPLIRTSIEKLGFKFTDVKILLTSHAHGDHVAGNFLVKELTGAKVYVMKGDEGIVESGGKGDFQGDSIMKPCKVDHVLKDGEEVKLGGATLTARLTPGHTKGCTTWTMVAEEAGKKYHVVVVGSPNVNPGYNLIDNPKYPEMAADFARTFRVLKSLSCDIFLGAHGEYYGLERKYEALQRGASGNPFVDPEGYREWVEAKEKEYLRKLAAQKKAAGR